MLPSDIRTVRDVVDFVQGIAEDQASAYQGSLKDYLCALWAVVQRHQQQHLSPALAGQILQDALRAAPAPIDAVSLASRGPSSQAQGGDDFEYLRRALHDQILSLHGGALERAQDLSVGLRWENATVASYLEAAASGFHDHSQLVDASGVKRLRGTVRDVLSADWYTQWSRIGRHVESEEFTWFDLAVLLELGQVYE